MSGGLYSIRDPLTERVARQACWTSPDFSWPRSPIPDPKNWWEAPPPLAPKPHYGGYSWRWWAAMAVISAASVYVIWKWR
jgi:hypothetical protein